MSNFGEKWGAVAATKRVAGVIGIADDIEVRLDTSIRLTVTLPARQRLSSMLRIRFPEILARSPFVKATSAWRERSPGWTSCYLPRWSRAALFFGSGTDSLQNLLLSGTSQSRVLWPHFCVSIVR